MQDKETNARIIIDKMLLEANWKLPGYVDGKDINVQKREWQNLIGYVPQNIYLSDNTIASNIAFGVPHHEINQDHKEAEKY